MGTHKIPVGILGATGVVGQRFIQLLEGHPWFEVAWLAASDRSEGKPYGEAVRWRLKTPVPEHIRNMQVSPAAPDGAPRVIFAALDAGIARELEPKFAEAGCAVVSNSSAFRMQQDVPLVIPRGQSRPSRAYRTAMLAQEIGWVHRHQPKLLSDWTGRCISPVTREVRRRVIVRNYDASGEWCGISGRGFVGHSWQCDSLHRQGRREDGRGDEEAPR